MLHEYDHSLTEKLNFANREINIPDIESGNFLILIRILKEIYLQDVVILQIFVFHLLILSYESFFDQQFELWKFAESIPVLETQKQDSINVQKREVYFLLRDVIESLNKNFFVKIFLENSKTQ